MPAVLPALHGAARRALLLAAVLLTAVGGVLLAPAEPAHAMPGAIRADATDPTLGPEVDEPLPVQVKLDAITPAVVTPGATITVKGTLHNTGTDTLDSARVRLQRDRPQTTRSEMAEVDADPPAYESQFTEWTDLDAVLPPGGMTTFTITTTAEDFGLADLGVYPVLVNVQASPPELARERVGQTATYLPFFAEQPTAPVGVAWLWPLIDRPHRTANEAVFLDDDLTTSLADGGRLNRMLALVDDVDPAANLTLVVDPALLDEVAAMARGNYQVINPTTGVPEAGAGQAVAVSWLSRLTKLAKQFPVVATPYADVDEVALDRAGLADQVTQARKEGLDVVERILDVTPVETVAWPVGGLLTDRTLDTAVRDGVRSFVLDASAFAPIETDPDEGGGTPAPISPLPSQAGPATALVTDAGLNNLVATGGGYSAGPVAAEQRYLAELAMISAEEPSVARTVLVTPPRHWEPPAQFAAGVLTAAEEQPWLSPAGVTALAEDAEQAGDAAVPVVDRGPLVYPEAAVAQELPAAGLAQLQLSVAALADFRSSLSNTDARTILGPYNRAVWRAASSAWRGDPAAFAAHEAAIENAATILRGQVTLVSPVDGTYTLSSSSAPVVLTVDNPLRVPVKVTVKITPRGVVGLTAEDIGVQEIPAESRRTIKVPTTVERSGLFTVVATLSTPDGGELGSPVQLKVQSTAYGMVALAVTGGAGALLLLLVGRRLVRRIRKATRPAPEPELVPAGPADRSLDDGLHPDEAAMHAGGISAYHARLYHHDVVPSTALGNLPRRDPAITPDPGQADRPHLDWPEWQTGTPQDRTVGRRPRERDDEPAAPTTYPWPAQPGQPPEAPAQGSPSDTGHLHPGAVPPSPTEPPEDGQQ